MSPFMAILTLAVLLGTSVFLVGLVLRKMKVILIGAPSALLLVVWFFLASSRPNPQEEFDRLFGADSRVLVSDIQTIKPTLMDGHFISFRMRASDFDSRVRPRFSERDLESPSSILLRQSLPSGWPAEFGTITRVLHREVGYHDVFLFYSPSREMAYASVRYDQW